MQYEHKQWVNGELVFQHRVYRCFRLWFNLYWTALTGWQFTFNRDKAYSACDWALQTAREEAAK
jgi:hypothetical protein